ncbi:MAG: hypothetical protein U0401_34400 [Anaerolineae bacterium]
MKFLPLIKLHLTHPYYTDNRCPDFWIEPTLATQRLLDNYRCLLKPTPNGIRVLIAVSDAEVPFIPLPPNMTFAFQLRLRNPDFALFTDLTEIRQTLAPVYTNGQSKLGRPAQLALVSRQTLMTERFAVRQPAREDRFVLSGRPLAGLQLADFSLAGLGTITHPTRYDTATKVITVNSQAASANDTFKITYAAAPQSARDVFADIEIQLNTALSKVTEGPIEFQVTFKAKKVRWNYYLLTDRAGAQFRIEDKGVEPLVFGDKNRVDLSQHPDPLDNVARMLAAQYATLRQLRFVSDDLVPCRQEARKSLQLYMDGQQVIGTLPNPALKNFSTLEITRNGSPSQEEVLFQVIKYFTHQFQATGG